MISLDGSPPLLEGFTLRRAGSRWRIEYYERGLIRPLGEFDSEADACDALYRTVASDPTMRVSTLRVSTLDR